MSASVPTDELASERERARQYLDIAGVVIVAINADQLVTLVNRKGCELLGRKEEEIVGCNWFDTFVPESERDKTRDGFEKLMSGSGEAQNFENSVVTANGELRRIAWQNMVIRDGDGKIIGTLSSGEDIGARRQLEQERERFRSLLDNTTDLVGMANADGRLHYLNGAARRLLGLRHDEDIGEKTVGDCHWAENGEQLIQEALSMVRRVGSWTGEVTWQAADGRLVPMLVSAHAHRNAQGEFEYCSMIAHDISALKKLENEIRALNHTLEARVLERTAHLLSTQEKLRDEKERTQRYLDIAGVALRVLDPEGRVTMINKRGCEMVEDVEENILGKDWFEEFVAADKRDKCRAVLVDLMARGPESTADTEVRIVTRSGKKRLIAWHSTVLRDESGSVLGTLSSGEDITDRRSAEEALRRSESQLRTITDSVPVLIAQVDREGRYKFNNQAYERFYGVGREKLKGTLVRDLIGEKAYATAGPQIARALAGQAVAFEVQVADKDGRLRDMAAQCVPDRDKSGDIQGFYAVVADITERKQLESALRESQRLEAVGMLASGISHDFNNLLMGIGGCANVALSRLDPDSPARIFLDEIGSAAASGASISRQLLDLSHQTGGDLADLPLDALVASTESMLRRLLGADISLRLDLRAGSARPSVAKGQLEQILLNLVVNARDAMTDGGVIDIETRAIDLDPEKARLFGLSPGPFLTLAVRDNGIGMESSTIERIFEPFFTTKRIGKGTGLGLSTVYGIVSQQGGHVDVQSKVGEGTTFTVYLPSSRLESRVPPGSELTGRRGSETVLVVEDDRLVMLAVRDYLSRSGYRVLEASDGDEAVQVAREHLEPISLLISDMVLPGMTGSKVAEAVHDIHPEVNVIYMSAHSAEMLAESGHVQQGTQTLQKPFGERELLARVHNVLDNHPAPHDPSTLQSIH